MTKQRLAIIAAAVILVAGVVAGRERPVLELIETRTAAAQTDGGISLEKLERRESAALPQTDPFARPAQPEPRAGAAQPARAEKPSAPPLPFKYFGRLTENGPRHSRWTVEKGWIAWRRWCEAPSGTTP